MEIIEQLIAKTEAVFLQSRGAGTESAAMYGLAEKRARDLMHATVDTITGITPKQRRRIVRIDQILNRHHVADLISAAASNISEDNSHPDFASARTSLDVASARINYLPFIERQVLRGQVKSIAKAHNRDVAVDKTYVPPRPKKADRKTYLAFDI